MRFETIDALSLLVSTYTTSIESAGVVIPEEVVALIGTDPFKACEALNELAVSQHVLTPEVDVVIEAVYESMDATDARSAATPEACERALAAFTQVHIEQPEPEPEPEVEAEPAPAEAASGEPEAEAESKPKKRTRSTRTRNKKNDQPETPAETPSAEAEPAAEEPAAAKSAGAPFEGDALSVDQALAILGIKRPKLTKLIESGELPAYKKGRSWQISANAVLDMAAGN